MGKRNSHHLVPNSKGGWDIKRGGGKKSLKHFDTKKAAEKFGRNVSRNQKSEFVIHRKDGTIQQSDSHGHDPHPPKG
jgi:hypothetical protein